MITEELTQDDYAQICDAADKFQMCYEEYRNAKKKHPHFVDTMSVWNAERIAWRLKGMREHLALPFTTAIKDFEDILMCEVLEALEAYLNGDYAHARQEFAQCAAVCVRAMEECEKKGGEINECGN